MKVKGIVSFLIPARLLVACTALTASPLIAATEVPYIPAQTHLMSTPNPPPAGMSLATPGFCIRMAQILTK
jgi:hypothetical protein